jgi:glycosyltransferase involved in cell wall biosynthesis
VVTAETPIGGHVDPPGVRVLRFPTVLRIGNAPLTPGMLAALGRVDLVHLHWPYIFGADLTLLTCALGRIPYVVTYHHDLVASLRWQFGPYQALIGPLVLRGARRIFPVSIDHFQASPMWEIAAAHRERIVEVPNGVDIRRFRPDVDGTAVRAKLGIPSGATVIGYLGAMDRAHPFKGVPVLLRALRQLRRPDVHLLAVGGGDLRPEYEAQGAALGLRQHWVGRVSDEALPAHVAAMDALVLPSLGFGAESFGIVLIEAMAAGKPVVATTLPGVRRVVDDGINGFLVPPGDEEALERALARLVDDPALRRRLGQAGRRKAEGLYDWRALAATLENEYLAVMRETSGS